MFKSRFFYLRKTLFLFKNDLFTTFQWEYRSGNEIFRRRRTDNDIESETVLHLE